MSARPFRGAVVTGGANGIGRQMALLLAAEGARVVLADRDASKARATAADVVARGGEALVVACDVADETQVGRLAEQASGWLPAIDLWVNNAGVLVTGELADLPLEDYRRVVDVNLWGVIHGCHHAVPRLRAQGHGHLLNVASLAGTIPLPFMGAYNATKAAVIALSETLHSELSAEGIGVTVLCPSFTQTGFVDAASGNAPSAIMVTARRIMRHLGDSPREVAALGLEAARRRRLYAMATHHGRLAWRAKRLSPIALTRAMGLAHRLVRSS